ncbi:hypothetical protein J6590_077130 [Homalodisca vitripennis]|nr:hypothetical protein J6590_077130 [Homalodisca vitripennis]
MNKYRFGPEDFPLHPEFAANDSTSQPFIQLFVFLKVGPESRKVKAENGDKTWVIRFCYKNKEKKKDEAAITSIVTYFRKQTRKKGNMKKVPTRMIPITFNLCRQTTRIVQMNAIASTADNSSSQAHEKSSGSEDKLKIQWYILKHSVRRVGYTRHECLLPQPGGGYPRLVPIPKYWLSLSSAFE